MYTTQTRNLQLGRILMLALTLLAASGLRAQDTPVITETKINDPGLVNIYGTGFGTTPGTVMLGGVATPVTSWSDTIVQFSTFTNWSVTEPVVLTTSTGATANLMVAFISATVGSATSDRDGTAAINAVSINGGGNQAHVSPSATFTVEFNYTTVCNASSCPIALQFGLDGGSPATCFYANVKNGSKSLTLKAPASPGMHYVLFDRNQNFCQAVWDYGTPPLSQSLGSIAVY